MVVKIGCNFTQSSEEVSFLSVMFIDTTSQHFDLQGLTVCVQLSQLNPFSIDFKCVEKGHRFHLRPLELL